MVLMCAIMSSCCRSCVRQTWLIKMCVSRETLCIVWWNAPPQETSRWAPTWTVRGQFWSSNLFIIFKKHQFSLAFLHFLQHPCCTIFNNLVKLTSPCKMMLPHQKVAKIAIFLLFFDDFWSHKETVGDHRGTGRGPHQNGLLGIHVCWGLKKANLVRSPTGPPAVPHRFLVGPNSIKQTQ